MTLISKYFWPRCIICTAYPLYKILQVFFGNVPWKYFWRCYFIWLYLNMNMEIVEKSQTNAMLKIHFAVQWGAAGIRIERKSIDMYMFPIPCAQKPSNYIYIFSPIVGRIYQIPTYKLKWHFTNQIQTYI